ncbi:hypothetical protein [Flavisolibacter tropicus]|uniref:Uncharacterized protein n=1 Tax=Flavisolibacter tropicus TaxID=1492898 RepID=A0A172TXG1_9BACT|nr:hypothetical protein [Flavisolibacter tropicus]ANE51463.1 hypothetical protein SY85_14065 [Flavisolibacter tropicus]
MARQAGPLFFTGTIDDITFYKMEGQYLARKKSSLNCKRFRTDPRFARSRKSAEKFGEASKLASEIYHQLPKEAKGKGVIGKLTREVGCLMREGKSIDEIKQALITYGQELVAIPKTIEATLTVRETKPAVATPALRFKQARYLSKWKVKPNGRLLIPGKMNSHKQNRVATRRRRKSEPELKKDILQSASKECS